MVFVVCTAHHSELLLDIALVKNNAMVGSRIAVRLAEIENWQGLRERKAKSAYIQQPKAVPANSKSLSADDDSKSLSADDNPKALSANDESQKGPVVISHNEYLHL